MMNMNYTILFEGENIEVDLTPEEKKAWDDSAIKSYRELDMNTRQLVASVENKLQQIFRNQGAVRRLKTLVGDIKALKLPAGQVVSAFEFTASDLKDYFNKAKEKEAETNADVNGLLKFNSAPYFRNYAQGKEPKNPKARVDTFVIMKSKRLAEYTDGKDTIKTHGYTKPSTVQQESRGFSEFKEAFLKLKTDEAKNTLLAEHMTEAGKKWVGETKGIPLTQFIHDVMGDKKFRFVEAQYTTV
jgi:hypothetical protein